MLDLCQLIVRIPLNTIPNLKHIFIMVIVCSFSIKHGWPDQMGMPEEINSIGFNGSLSH